MDLSSLLAFVLLGIPSQPPVHGFSPLHHSPSTPTTANLLTASKTTTNSKQARYLVDNPSLLPNGTFDSRTESSKEEDIYGIAFSMAMASTASLGINANNWIDSFSFHLTERDIEAEVLRDVSHLVSDLITIAAPTLPCLPLRLAAFLGRVLSIAADYIPDHMILPDELFFQSLMLLLSGKALVQTLQPKIVAAITLPKTFQSIRDGKTYAALFQPTGMTWDQYKSLSASAMDWIDVGSNQEVVVSPPTTTNDTSMDGNKDDLTDIGNEGYIYWLYRGCINITNNQGKQLYTHTSSGGGRQLKQTAFRGLFGETSLLQSLEKKTINQHPSSKSLRSTPFQAKISEDAQQTLALRAGPSGATFLRIRASALTRLTDHDEDLASCVRILLFYGLSSKLGVAQQSEQ